jgi:hypothetical protein
MLDSSYILVTTILSLSLISVHLEVITPFSEPISRENVNIAAAIVCLMAILFSMFSLEEGRVGMRLAWLRVASPTLRIVLLSCVYL